MLWLALAYHSSPVPEETETQEGLGQGHTRRLKDVYVRIEPLTSPTGPCSLSPEHKVPSWVVPKEGLIPQAGWAQSPEMHACCQSFGLATHLLPRGRIPPQVTDTPIPHSPSSPVVDPNTGPLPLPPGRAGGHAEATRKLVLSWPLGTSLWRARKGPWPLEARESVRDYGLLAWK